MRKGYIRAFEATEGTIRQRILKGASATTTDRVVQRYRGHDPAEDTERIWGNTTTKEDQAATEGTIRQRILKVLMKIHNLVAIYGATEGTIRQRILKVTYS